ncbi:hypothetical protein JCM10213v2_004163 [Rhodosporidiobolus nylandii]
MVDMPRYTLEDMGKRVKGSAFELDDLSGANRSVVESGAFDFSKSARDRAKADGVLILLAKVTKWAPTSASTQPGYCILTTIVLSRPMKRNIETYVSLGATASLVARLFASDTRHLYTTPLCRTIVPAISDRGGPFFAHGSTENLPLVTYKAPILLFVQLQQFMWQKVRTSRNRLDGLKDLEGPDLANALGADDVTWAPLQDVSYLLQLRHHMDIKQRKDIGLRQSDFEEIASEVDEGVLGELHSMAASLRKQLKAARHARAQGIDGTLSETWARWYCREHGLSDPDTYKRIVGLNDWAVDELFWAMTVSLRTPSKNSEAQEKMRERGIVSYPPRAPPAPSPYPPSPYNSYTPSFAPNPYWPQASSYPCPRPPHPVFTAPPPPHMPSTSAYGAPYPPPSGSVPHWHTW